jgi:L-ascorbate metabolism protein UlaG (beta-lactamase superfamily)
MVWAICFKITTPGGRVILIDPFITKNPKTPEALKDLGKLGKIDLILVTHGHGDHVGDTAEISKMSGAKVAMNADMGHTFAALGWVPYDRLIRFNKSGTITPLVTDIRIAMVQAQHSSDVVYTDPATQKKTETTTCGLFRRGYRNGTRRKTEFLKNCERKYPEASPGELTLKKD